MFLDGMLTGTAVEVKTRIDNEVATRLKKMMEKAGASFEKGELGLPIEGKGGFLLLSLRKEKGKDRWFLNLSGNPITFVQKTNVFGYGEPGQQILDCFRVAVKRLEKMCGKAAPAGLKDQLSSGNININSLEFAAYTKKMKNKKLYLSTLQHVWGSAAVRCGDSRTSLESLLNVTVTQNVDNQTIGFRFPYLRRGVGKLLLLYDKYEQMQAKYPEIELKDLEKIKDRLRFDLHLTKIWMESRRIQTVGDLQKRFGRDEVGLVAQEIRDCVDKACLVYMFEITKERMAAWAVSGIRPEWASKDISFETHQAILWAMLTDVDDKVKHDQLFVPGRGFAVLEAMKNNRQWKIPSLEIEQCLL